jgi:hypothetical protein
VARRVPALAFSVGDGAHAFDVLERALDGRRA